MSVLTFHLLKTEQKNQSTVLMNANLHVSPWHSCVSLEGFEKSIYGSEIWGPITL